MEANANCSACKAKKNCLNPKIRGVGNNVNPEFIFVLPAPEVKDDTKGQEFKGERSSLVVNNVLQHIDVSKCYFTYLVKCACFENAVSRTKLKKHTKVQMKHCYNFLLPELSIPNAKIMLFGKAAMEQLLGDDKRIMRDAGKVFSHFINNEEKEIMVNLDPGMALKQEQHMALFTNNIKKFAKGDIEVEEDVEKVKICNYDEAIEALNKTITLYKEKKIDFTVFDIENSINFDPWGGGEILMISIANKVERTGFTILLSVNNDIHHWRDITIEESQDIEVFLDSYDKEFPFLASRLPDDIISSVENYDWDKVQKAIDSGKKSRMPKDTPKLPDYDFDIPVLDIEIDKKQAAKLKVKIKEVLELVPIVGHNLKYDCKWSFYHKYCDIDKVTIYNDTNNQAFQYQNTGIGISNKLKDLCRKYLYVSEDWDKVIDIYVKKFKKVVDRHYGNIPTGLLAYYAGLDAHYNLLLQEFFEENYSEKMKPVLNLVNSAIKPFVKIETHGIKLDNETMEYLSVEYTKYLEDKYEEITQLFNVRRMLDKYIGPFKEKNDRAKKKLTETELKIKAFNINSPDKIAELVYSKDFFGLPEDKRFKTKPTKTKPSGSPQVNKLMREEYIPRFKKLKDECKDPNEKQMLTDFHNFLTMLHDYKRISKLNNDYIKAMPASTNDKGFYIPNFNLNGTTTGRLSSPFHSMPNGCDIKRTVISRWRDEGGLIIAPDYSQLEYRTIAGLSNEKEFINSFIKGEDLHRFTASKAFRKSPEEITKEERQKGKRLNFSMIFGVTAMTLAADMGITIKEAQAMLDSFYNSLFSLKHWKHNVEEMGNINGYIETMFGRKIPIAMAGSNKKWEVEEAKRCAVSYTVQGTATDVVLNTVLDVEKGVYNRKLRSLLLASVHDSIEYDVYPGEIFNVVGMMKHYGQDSLAGKYDWLNGCPIKLDFELGTSWGGTIEAKIEEISKQHVNFRVEGLRRDFKDIVNVAQRAYNVDIVDSSHERLPDGIFGDDVFYKDNVNISANLILSQK